MTHVITGSHHFAAAPPGVMTFYSVWDDWHFVKVTGMGDGGAAVVSHFDANDIIGKVYSPEPGIINTLRWYPATGRLNCIRSTDDGANYSWIQDLELVGTFTKWAAYAQIYAVDKSNQDLCWMGTADDSIAYPPNNENPRVWYTKDGGATWSTISFGAVGAANHLFMSYAVSAHDGRYGYLIVTVTTKSIPYTGSFTTTIYRIDSTDGTYTSKSFAVDGNWDQYPERGFFRGSVVYGTSDNLYLTTFGYESLYKFVWSTGALTLLHDGDPASGTHIDDNQALTKQIMTSKAGSLFMVMSPYIVGDSAIRKIYKSTNAGTDWTLHDVTAQCSFPSAIQWDYIAESQGTLYLCLSLNNSGSVYGVYSTDDGETWLTTGDQLIDEDLIDSYDLAGC